MLRTLALWILATGGPPALLLLYVFHNVEKVEKWAAVFQKALSAFPRVFSRARRSYVKLDLQGRVNAFTKDLHREAPYLAEQKVEIEFVETDVSRAAFLKSGKVVLRLHHDDHDEKNFAHAAYLFVSTSLLSKIKRYISPSQREAIDLYVTTKLIEQQKPAVVDQFLEEYLHPRLEDPESRVSQHYDSFAALDEMGYFYPVFLQELDFLGAKVFGGKRDERIVKDVNSLIEFLKNVSGRLLGEEMDLEFVGSYCKVAVVIIGKSFKLGQGAETWVNYVRGHLLPKNIDTVYLLGRIENRDLINKVADGLAEHYGKARVSAEAIAVRDSEGRAHELQQHLVILRRVSAPVYVRAEKAAEESSSPPRGF